MSQNVQWKININGVRKFENDNYIPYEILIRQRRLKFKIAFQCVLNERTITDRNADH